MGKWSAFEAIAVVALGAGTVGNAGLVVPGRARWASLWVVDASLSVPIVRKLTFFASRAPFTLIILKIQRRRTTDNLTLEPIKKLSRPTLRANALRVTFNKTKRAITFISHRIVYPISRTFRSFVARDSIQVCTWRALACVDNWVPELPVCASDFWWNAVAVNEDLISWAFTCSELLIPYPAVGARI